jgi:hypothetical protein
MTPQKNSKSFPRRSHNSRGTFPSTTYPPVKYTSHPFISDEYLAALIRVRITLPVRTKGRALSTYQSISSHPCSLSHFLSRIAIKNMLFARRLINSTVYKTFCISLPPPISGKDPKCRAQSEDANSLCLSDMRLPVFCQPANSSKDPKRRAPLGDANSPCLFDMRLPVFYPVRCTTLPALFPIHQNITPDQRKELEKDNSSIGMRSKTMKAAEIQRYADVQIGHT